MSSGNELQAMEEDVKQSKTAVNANAAPAQPMEKLSTGGTSPTAVSYTHLTLPTKRIV